MAYRILRAVKNRFGATNEIGVFEMDDSGLREVPNPSQALLEGRPHMALNPAGLLLEEANCRCFGGGLYALDGGIAAAYVHEGVTEVRELLGAPPEAAAALGAALGTAETRLWTPAREGEPYLAFAPDNLPADTIWNLAFD